MSRFRLDLTQLVKAESQMGHEETRMSRVFLSGPALEGHLLGLLLLVGWGTCCIPAEIVKLLWEHPAGSFVLFHSLTGFHPDRVGDNRGPFR